MANRRLCFFINKYSKPGEAQNYDFGNQEKISCFFAEECPLVRSKDNRKEETIYGCNKYYAI